MLTVRTALGAGWLVSSRLGGRLIDFATLLVLARTLSPADFGLTALAMSLIAVVDTVFEIPLTQALTRLREIDRSHLDTAFTLALARSVLLVLVIIAASRPFAMFYSDGRLTPLIIVLSCGPIARGLYSPAMVHFVRSLSFRPAFTAEMVGKVAAVASAMLVATQGGGYWAIAANSIAYPILATVASYMLAPYRPAFSFARMADFKSFVGWYSAAQLVSAFNWQFDRVMLGHFTTRADLGRYAMASDLAALPTQSLIGPAMQPVMAAFATINHDIARLRAAYLKASFVTMLLALPICVGISLTSDLAIAVLLGPKWQDAGAYLQWLSLTIPLTAYFQTLYSLALAIDRPSAIFRLNIIEAAFRVTLISLGLMLFVVNGVIAARGVISVIMFILSLATARLLIGVGIGAQLLNLWRVCVGCAVMAAFVLLLRSRLSDVDLPAVVKLVSTAAFGAAAYGGTLFALGLRLSPGQLRRKMPGSVPL